MIDNYNGIKLGISTLGYSKLTRDVTYALSGLADIGYKYFEYSDMSSPFLDSGYLSGEKIRELKKLVDMLGVKIISLHLPPDNGLGSVVSLDRAERAHAMKIVRRSLENGGELGIEYAVFHPSEEEAFFTTSDSVSEAEKRLMDAANELADVGEKNGIKILLENLLGRFNGDIGMLGRVIRSIGKERIGLCFDLAHFWLGNSSPAAVINENRELMSYLHIHDNNKKEDEHLMPGEGSIDWSEISRALHDINYQGVFMLETVSSRRYKNPYSIAKEAKRICEESFGIPDANRVAI
jgi:sugar phosphate isomerase/epimerase